MDGKDRFDRHEHDTRDEDESVVVPEKESSRDTSDKLIDRALWPAEKRLVSVFPSETKYCGTRRTKNVGMM